MNNSTTNLYNLVSYYQMGDKNIFIDIYQRFLPLIKKYGNKLNYDGANSDMTISLIDIVNKLPINKNPDMSKEAVIVSYINIAIKHSYIFFSKKNNLINQYETPIDVFLNYETCSNTSTDPTDNIYLKELLNKLTKKEKDILTLKYIDGYSDLEIASSLNISRQAVNKTKNRALKKYKILYTKEKYYEY